MPQALIVAHGAPSNPNPQNDAVAALAKAVGALLPDWLIRGATLAKPGALEAALQGMTAPLIYPFFMAEGWFTGRELPRRVALAGGGLSTQIRPFGTDPHLPALIAQTTIKAAKDGGIDPNSTTLILAAHGSKVARKSKDSSYAMAKTLRDLTPFADIRVGLIEEPPFLADVARLQTPALCLPFFALRAGHVEGDIPDALAKAGFAGPLLDAIGEHPSVPALIAAALKRSASQPPA
ncbi:CbiX/SirB N-terminal domain-containing protein [Phaeovulum sp.]|uniref:CbiX/SirB N-terminal domain-containing protein n=1 Tax=Phaeovulum sp. TaxID=2934796 RepID=UPI0039E46449